MTSEVKYQRIQQKQESGFLSLKGKIYAHWLQKVKETTLFSPRDSAWREKFKRNFKWSLKPELGQWVDNPTQFTHSDINLIWTI